MKTITCEYSRENVALLRDGLLDADMTVALRNHIAECAVCAEEVQSDTMLVRALSSLPESAPSPISWQGVLAQRRRQSIRRSQAWKPAFTATLVIAAGLVFQQNRTKPPEKPSVAIVHQIASDPFVGAHGMMSAYDMGSDPNRIVVAMGSHTTEEITR
jgi:anti-sigma factor RsiW